MRKRFLNLSKLGLAALTLAATVAAQNPPQAPVTTPEAVAQPTAKPKTLVRRPTTPPVRVVVAAQSQPTAPQVVTVVHQLSGFKMLRLLLRQDGEQDVVAMINEPLAMTSEVHTNIIAGLAFDNGQTIAVCLPQGAAEIDAGVGLPRPPVEIARATGAVITGTPPKPNLSVVFSDGKRSYVSYVGLDVTTGVSVLHVNATASAVHPQEANDKPFEGQRVRLVAPQRAEAPANIPAGTIYARIGETYAKLEHIRRTSAGRIERLTAVGVNLTPAFVGGVAVDESGATLGIVQGIEHNQARILPASVVEAAVRRVIERQASVPRPLLGVRGEPVEFTSRRSFLDQGWREEDLTGLFGKPSGIFLTSVLPNTPAAFAKLRPGDVIVRVNEDEVKSEDDFSSMLREAGSGAAVNFTLLRPSHPAPESIVVKLGGSLEPFFERQFITTPGFPTMAEGPLTNLGIETFALSPRVASAFGGQGGLLVLAVQPESTAASAGVREGDLIEAIDGRPATRTYPFFVARKKAHTLTIVRDRERIEITVELKLKTQP
jgi:S1-C subfamily serine protease